MLFPLSSVEQMGRVCGDRFWMPFRIISFWVCVVDAHYSRLGEAILMGVCFCGGGGGRGRLSLVIWFPPYLFHCPCVALNFIVNIWNVQIRKKHCCKLPCTVVTTLKTEHYSCTQLAHKVMYPIYDRMVDGVYPDQTAPFGAVWSGYTLF